ncbi:MAG: hypothetical protein AAF825_12250 [Pseudomonadota bacterium]
MTTFLPPDVQAGLDAARKGALRENNRLRIQDGENEYRVLHAWENGFSLDRDVAQTMRGRVDLYDGARHLSQCLIVASEQDGDVMRFEFKRLTDASDTQPLDFVRAVDAPIALIGNG